MPWTTSGRIGTPASIARRNAPSLNGSRSAVVDRVPSGKIITETRLASASRHRAMASSALGPKPRWIGMSPASLQQPAQHRNPEQLRLGQPLHFPGQVADEQDVHERLVVRHHDVGAARIGGHGAGAAESPERVERRHDDRDLPEDVADRVAAGVERRRHQPHHRHDRQPDQRRRRRARARPRSRRAIATGATWSSTRPPGRRCAGAQPHGPAPGNLSACRDARTRAVSSSIRGRPWSLARPRTRLRARPFGRMCPRAGSAARGAARRGRRRRAAGPPEAGGGADRPARGPLGRHHRPVRPGGAVHALLRPRVPAADRPRRPARLPAEPGHPRAQAGAHPRAARRGAGLLALLGALGAGGYSLADPAREWMAKAPQSLAEGAEPAARAAAAGRAGDPHGRAGRGGDGGEQERAAGGGGAGAAAQRAALRHDAVAPHRRARDAHPALLPARRRRPVPAEADQGAAAARATRRRRWRSRARPRRRSRPTCSPWRWSTSGWAWR